MDQHPEDKEIIELFAQGGRQSEQAFKLLVGKFGDSLYRHIFRYTKNHDQTNDVLQNVLIKVFQNLSGFKQDSSLYTWLYRIGRNEALNFLDKEKRRTGVDMDSEIIEIIAGHEQLDQLDGDTISKLLERAIDQLPEKQAIVFQLKYFDDLKYNEISAKLSTSEGALKASFHHAKQKIEEFILNELNHLEL